MKMQKQSRLAKNDANIKPEGFMRIALNGTPKQSENDPDTVLFEGGQEIANNTTQKDGTFYDIPSLDIDNYNGKIYEDHNYGYKNVLGKAINVVKDVVNNRVTIGGIKFSKKNPNARLAKDLLLEGLAEFSQGTIGATNYETGERKDHRLIDISIVGMGNNDYTLAEVATQNGYNLANYNLNESEKGTQMKYFVYNLNSFAAKFLYKNDAGEDVEVEVPAGDKVEVPSAEIAQAAQADVDSAKAPETEDGASSGATTEDEAAEGKKPDTAENSVSIAELNSVKSELAEIKKNMNTPAKPNTDGGIEDTNKFGTGTSKNSMKELEKMTAGERLYEQVMLERNGQGQSARFLEINEFNKEKLLDKLAKENNAFTPDDISLGGLIPPYELLDKISACETEYAPFLSRFGFEQDGLSYGWNMQIGDIEFSPVGYCDPSPESDFETQLQTRTQERLATHSVICNKTTRFSPVNIINHIARRYQGAYDKALVMFAMAELQVAADKRVAGLNRPGGTSIAADPNGSLTYPAAQKDQAGVLAQLFTDLSDCTTNGLYIMNTKTAAKLILDLNVGSTGFMQTHGTTTVRDYQRLSAALGGEVLVVPNSVLPTLGTNETIVVPRTQDGGGNVTINHAIFYVAPENFRGVTNGGLAFDINSFAPYEVSVQKEVTVGSETGTVTVIETRSPRQRGETVMFGEMYRGGGVYDFRKVGGIKAATV